MIERLIGVSVGALVTFLILWLSDITNQADLVPWYVAAAVIGAIVSFFWPVVAGIWLGRRTRAWREDAVEQEVQRRLADERAKKAE